MTEDREVPGKDMNSGSPMLGTFTRKPVIGLVGGMGSGKSLVAAEFARHGAQVVSADQLGHEGLCQPEIREELVRRWGTSLLDDRGEINRRIVAAIVFANPQERQALESMVFPWIKRRIREEIAHAQESKEVRLVVLDAAIMLEAGWDHVCDRLIYVHAPRAIRLQRLAEQRGWSAKEVEAREQAQMSLTDKVNRADEALDNSFASYRTARQVQDLLRRWNLIHYS